MKVYVGMDQNRTITTALFVASTPGKAEDLIEKVEAQFKEVRVELEEIEMDTWE